jgi:hypothetical protein
MADQRTPRDLVSREKTQRFEYKPPSTLPDPAPQAGWAFRWVATHVLGTADPRNTSQKFREGWVPVKAEDHPEIAVPGAVNASGNIEIGGLVLCKISAEIARARDEYYARQTADQTESVDRNFMRENDARMPLFAQRKTEVSFGRGS